MLTNRIRAIVDTLPADGAVTLTVATLREWLAAEPAESAPPARTAEPDRCLTVDDVAALLSVSDRWVRNHRKELGGFGTAKMLRFPAGKIQRWIERSRKS